MLGSNASVALGALATPQGQRRGANALLALAAIALAVVTWRAVRLDPLPSALPGAPAASGAGGAVVASRADEEDAVDIDNDPFRLDRQLPDPPEAEESTVNIRRLGSRDQVSMGLEEALAAIVEEAMPPDLKRRKAQRKAAA